jgi:hypothetical protein
MMVIHIYVSSLHGPAPRNKLKVIFLLNVWFFNLLLLVVLSFGPSLVTDSVLFSIVATPMNGFELKLSLYLKGWLQVISDIEVLWCLYI